MSKAGFVLIVLPTLAFALGTSAACAGSTGPDGVPPTTSSCLETFDSSGRTHLEAALRELPARMPSVSEPTRLRRRIADATFCLPQNILGVLYYAFLQLTGNVLDAAEAAEGKLIVTRTPFGTSLGRYIFVSEPLLCESALRHEYGHVMQGYKRGPFYLLFEGVTSFVQAILSLASASFARDYFDRWPENEAERLGAAAWPPNQRWRMCPRRRQHAKRLLKVERRPLSLAARVAGCDDREVSPGAVDFNPPPQFAGAAESRHVSCGASR